ARGCARGPSAHRPWPRPARPSSSRTPPVAAYIGINGRVTSLAALGPIGTIGRYEIIGRLATGGMAEISLARETGRHATRLVVVKRILPHIAEDPVLVEMFLLEARLSMNLAHPNIC